MKIYVASSWRNIYQPVVVKALRDASHDVYDFKDSLGFGWHEVDSMYENWVEKADIESYLKGLNHPRAIEGFARDMNALNIADAVVYVLPCGISASLELGYAVGKGKLTIVYIPELKEPELMFKMCDNIVTSFDSVISLLEQYSGLKK